MISDEKEDDDQDEENEDDGADGGASDGGGMQSGSVSGGDVAGRGSNRGFEVGRRGKGLCSVSRHGPGVLFALFSFVFFLQIYPTKYRESIYGTQHRSEPRYQSFILR